MKRLLLFYLIFCPLVFSAIPEQSFKNGFFIDDYVVWARNKEEFKRIRTIVNVSGWSQGIINMGLGFKYASFNLGEYKPKTSLVAADNVIKDLKSKAYYAELYVPLVLGSFVIAVSSIPHSSNHFANAYAYTVRNDKQNAMYHAGMGIGLAINGAVLASGGASQLPSNVKYTLYGISGAAAFFEAKNQFQQGREFWGEDYWRAGYHFVSAGLFATGAALPFALNYYKKKSE